LAEWGRDNLIHRMSVRQRKRFFRLFFGGKRRGGGKRKPTRRAKKGPSVSFNEHAHSQGEIKTIRKEGRK